MIWLDAVVQGVLLGGLYALLAIGISVAYRVTRVVNLAHGELILLVAWVIVLLGRWLGMGPFVAAALAAPALFALGWLLQRHVLNRTLGSDVVPPLVVTFGLAVVIQEALPVAADGDPVAAAPFGSVAVALGPVTVGLMPLLALVSAVGVILALQGLLRHGRAGRRVRAVSDDPETAMLIGIRPARVFAGVSGVALVAATVAALYLGVGLAEPATGAPRLIHAFEAALIGGLGSLWGALAGGVVIGVAQTVGGAIDPEWQVLAGHAAFIVVMLVRPRGLFPGAVV